MAIGITKGLLSWKFQSNYVERLMDNAAYEAAHPDDSLVLAGPPRLSSVLGSATDGVGSLLAIGMLQQLSVSSSKPSQPMMAIGSGRSFFVSGKSQTSFNISRLFVNGRNLLRVLYHNAVAGGIDVSLFDDPAAIAATSKFFGNLDSELYYVPFGLGVIIRTKLHDLAASFYLELAMINSYSLSLGAGQSMIMETVSGVCDRMLPMRLSDLSENAANYIPRETVDQVLGFTDPVAPNSDLQAEDGSDYVPPETTI